MANPIQTNHQRLWQSLMAIAEIGATKDGGCNRQALTDLDQQGRDLFIQWCKEAGCHIRIDRIGNIFARREGKNTNSPSVMTGSHLDTQPTGGKFDGVYGVLAGLEVIRTLNDLNIETEHPIEVSVWTNEEGARFAPAMIGSGVWCGEFSLEYGLNRSDQQGKTIAQELQRIGYAGETPCTPHPVKGFFETHIEQGPVLESKNKQIGIVTGVQGMNWYDLHITGKPVHAGPTPMAMRKDPFMALHKIIGRLYQIAEAFGQHSRVTLGNIQAFPGAYNTVPKELILAVDLRHPEQEKLDQMQEAFYQIVEEETQDKGLASKIAQQWQSPAVVFNKNCVTAVTDATAALKLSSMKIVSGAGHDSVYLSRVIPTSMIFVPCEGGISHNPAENATKEDLGAGCDVLLNAMVEMAS